MERWKWIEGFEGLYKISDKSECRKGEDNPFYGKHHTEETKQTIMNCVAR